MGERIQFSLTPISGQLGRSGAYQVQGRGRARDRLGRALWAAIKPTAGRDRAEGGVATQGVSA